MSFAKNSLTVIGLATCLCLIFLQPTSASIVTYEGTGAATGLSAEADFTLLNGGTTLQVILTNTSTAPPGGAAQVLSSINFGLSTNIIGGSAALFGGSEVVENDGGSWDTVKNGGDLNDEYGYSNNGVGNSNSGAILSNITETQIEDLLFSAATSHSNGGNNVTTFNGDSGLPGGLDFGLITDLSPFGNNTFFVLDSVILTLNLESALTDLSFLDQGSYVEFGSDYAFVGMNGEIPEPTSLFIWSLLGITGITFSKCRRRKQ